MDELSTRRLRHALEFSDDADAGRTPGQLAFDPAVRLELTHVQSADSQKSGLGAFLTPLAGRLVKREWLL